MNKNMTLRGYYGLLLVFIWDTFHYNITDRINTCYDYRNYLRGHNYAYTFAVLIVTSLYLMLVKFRVKITIETSFM
jgi:hypothetical protein